MGAPNQVGALRGIWHRLEDSGLAGSLAACVAVGFYRFDLWADPMVKYTRPIGRYAVGGALIGAAWNSALAGRWALDRLSQPVSQLEWSNGVKITSEQARGYDVATTITGIGICGGSILTFMRMALRK